MDCPYCDHSKTHKHGKTSNRAQLVHNEEVKEIETDQVIADEMWSFVKKTETLRT